ncbi:MAG: HAD family hydrolase [Oscillospiraceae bacterium]|nr:HAD family hydrolase [Oscillospiraceae bacterium]
MKTKVILFDLDGTLLPMDQEIFVKAYFKGIAKRLAPHGYDPEKLIKSIWGGTEAMIANNGEKTNEAVFWDFFATVFGERSRADEPKFAEFYEENFDDVSSVCGHDERADRIVKKIKEKGMKVALATNPIFPQIATRKRMKWAGLDENDFELYTTYENSNYCKPNLDYYRVILNQLGVAASECVMVGNDVGDDMVTQKLGMKVFLLTDNLINKNNEDISEIPQGGFDELEAFIDTLD